MDDSVTPMMAQYLGIKADYPDALLFYRMGDFYELFFDDAVAASAALDITLTRRGKHLGTDIAMCGVPVHASEAYLLTLIRKGFRVAVCEQTENPAEARKRGAKAVVQREVVRLVTPGTLTEESLLDARRHNFLAAFAQVRDDAALAWVDISTGMFNVMALDPARLAQELARLAPNELLLAEGTDSVLSGIVKEAGAALSLVSRASFDSQMGARRLCALFGVASLDAYGTFERAEVSAMAAVVDYLDLTQKGRMPLLRPPVHEGPSSVVQIDAATRRSLELTHGMGGGRAGSLLSAIDRTVTAGGARLLERRLGSPSRLTDEIRRRQDAVSFHVEHYRNTGPLRDLLRQTHDLDRALSRLALDRGGPRDLGAIRNTLAIAARICASSVNLEMPELLHQAVSAMTGQGHLRQSLDAALVAEPPLLTRDGGFIAAGFDRELDTARQLRDDGRSVVASLQARYAAQTGNAALKVKHNNVLGYFIETTDTHAGRMLSPPLNETFFHRQTTASQLRFTTAELSELETRILNAGAHAQEIEKRLFHDLRAAVLEQAGPLAAMAQGLAEIDLCAGLAELAVAEGWCCPGIDESRTLDIQAGRHPVVEQALRRAGLPFVSNDCDLTESPLWLLTGPNMAGKSTFLRQIALIVILAQMGSFVPAARAEIGIVSQIFSRVGAADDLARGRSTFMVEMVETAAILHQADDKALVILDEIGRGTATYDGLSIAWATLEHLHDVNRCRALFATHYHEMAALSTRLQGVENATVSVKEFQGDVVFLHEVRKGTADRSYGIQVAKLAGLPAAVVERARIVLDSLEKGERDGGGRRAALIDDLPLFAAVQRTAPMSTRGSAVEERLSSVLPDDLSPKEALALIYELKGLARNDGQGRGGQG